MRATIDAAAFKQMILHGAAAISLQKQKINDLNVFPVPDGDTGTNMSMTIATAAAELRKIEPESVGQAASVCASALLRGARGNSGVILSLLFRGISKELKGQQEADGWDLAAAMQEGVAAAYGAVMKPAEGTVLTVARLAAKRATEVAEENRDAEFVLNEAIQTGYEVLPQTTEMNPVLKKANVVDAGAKGYLVILEGMLAALRGEPLPELTEEEPQQEKADFDVFSTEEITFAFDTVFIVRKTVEKSLNPLREYLNSIGDSLVIGEDDEAFKVHVHTNIPGDALKEAQKYGTLELAKIENMRTQAEDLAAGKHVQSTDDLEAVEAELEEGTSAAPAKAAPEKPYGFVTVCAGDGMAAVFKDLGVDGIVSGGQSMNPSTQDILREIDKTPAETVYVLPNNKNIIMAAEQCIPLCEDKKVVVIPTKTVPQGIAAMMAVDPDAPEGDNTSAMTEALSRVATSEITYAARDSDFDGFDIKQGDYLALVEHQLFGTDQDLDALLDRLANAPAQQDAEFISIFYGADVTEEEAQKTADIFSQACPGAEVTLLRGGQPVYYYMISAE